MTNRNCKTANPLTRSHSSQKLKFQQLPRQFNELNSKYELYKHGTPNQYSQDIQALRANTISNDLSVLQLTGIQYIINQISQSDKQKQVNQRNYDLYPTLLAKSNVRYKDMLSEKQEIKDFILWFQTQYQTIEQNIDSPSNKFHHKQTLIAAGFTEMTTQIAKVSKNRAEILKMLWNRQNSQVTSIVESINDQNLKKEKELLQSISNVHQSYQQEIQVLRVQNKQLEQESRREKEFGKSCVSNLRVLRRRIKKIEYMLKKLGESNLTIKRENLHLLEENIKLLMNVKEVTQEEAVILNYRKLQIHQQKHKLSQQNNKKLIKLAQSQDNPIQDFHQKKDSLYKFFVQRIAQNPDQKGMIKQEYFTQEENEGNASIEDYFKNIINRPNVQVELLTEVLTESISKDQAVNTELIQQQEVEKPVLLLQKGIQVQSQFGHRQSRSFQRKYYHIIDQREEQLIDKESKKRIIQHRQSRKNSLTLLELERLNELQSKPLLKPFHQKPSNHATSGFSRKTRKQSKVQNEAVYQEDHIDQSSSSEDNMHLSQIKGQPTVSRVLSNSQPNRKNKQFNQLLLNITTNHQKPQNTIKDQTLRLQGEEHIFTYSELRDLIDQHLAKSQQGKPLRNPEKSLNKVLLALFRNVNPNSPNCFMFALLQVIKTSYGNIKSVMWKFLTIVSNIQRHQSTNSMLKVAALLLKVSDKFKIYDQVNSLEITELYFRLFFLLSIKAVTEISFNLWKACTSLEKIKSSEFLKVLSLFFSEKKQRYIENKVKEFIAASQESVGSHGEATRTPVEQAQIVKLNPLLLYIMEFYLIEKQLLHASYSIMIDFLAEDEAIPSQIILWLINLLGFEQQSQKQMFSFLLLSQKQTNGFCKADMFYRCCVRFDFPLMEEVEVCTYRQFKQLPTDVQQKYFRMIGMQEWSCLKDELTIGFKKSCESAVYLKAFEMVAEKLQSQICRGVSIYGEQGQKRKQQVFSLFYKILIVQAHCNCLQRDGLRECLL